MNTPDEQQQSDGESGLALSDVLKRAFRLRCPRCGEERLFQTWFRMAGRCSRCALQYERGPGYFLGSTYINYGVTAVLLTTSYVALHFGVGIENRILTAPLLLFCAVFPLCFFRWARSVWLAVDVFLDREGAESATDQASQTP